MTFRTRLSLTRLEDRANPDATGLDTSPPPYDPGAPLTSPPPIPSDPSPAPTPTIPPVPPYGP